MTDMSLPTYTDLELRVFGIRRTGNHAIISWIMDGLSGVVIHLNNLRLPNNNEVDPYHAVRSVVVKGLPYYRCRSSLWEAFKKTIKRPSHFIFYRGDPKLDLDYILTYPHKNGLIYSYENCSLAEPSFNQFSSIGGQCVGVSRKQLEIVILRDPCNLFASLLASKMMTEDNQEELVNLFKQYAREFLGQTQLLDRRRPVIFINYNTWCLSTKYKKEMALNFGFQDRGETYNFVSPFGGGSSFNKTQLSGKAQEMKVLERWRHYQDDPHYRAIFADEEIGALSRQIFGEVAPELGC